MTTDTEPRRLRIRWWHLAIATVVLLLAALVTTAYAWRAMGRARYQAVIDQRHAAGKPATIDDFVTMASAVDRRVQTDWDAWSTSATTARSSVLSDLGPHQDDWTSWVTGHGPRPSAVDALIASHAPNMAGALPLLRSGKLVLSAAGWAVEDLPPERRRMPFASSLRMPSLLMTRELAEWLRHAAVLAADPQEPLRDLDALLVAMSKPRSLIDAMIALTISAYRDRAYADLALSGRLSTDVKQRWLAEPSRSLLMVADGFSGEHLLFGDAMARWLEVSPFRFVREGQDQDGTWLCLAMWATGFQDCAVISGVESHIEPRLRGERSDLWPSYETLRPSLGPLGRSCLPNLPTCVISGLEFDSGHRLARLAVRVIDLARSGALPTDQAALITALNDPLALTPPGDHLHLRYEVPAPGRFRLVIDPSSPTPNFDDPTRMKIRSGASGTPPAKGPLVWTRTTCVEVLMPPTP